MSNYQVSHCHKSITLHLPYAVFQLEFLETKPMVKLIPLISVMYMLYDNKINYVIYLNEDTACQLISTNDNNNGKHFTRQKKFPNL